MSETRTVDGRTLYAYWVCQDCYMWHHYGKVSDDPDYRADRESMALMAGLSWVADWTYDPDDADRQDEIERDGPGIQEFSWVPCEGCGSNLGGSRYRLASDR